jgi:energy-coupling factor transporter transmembrane protein EcfT
MLIIAAVIYAIAGATYLTIGTVEYIVARIKRARWRRVFKTLHGVLLVLLGIIYILLALSYASGVEPMKANHNIRTERWP